MILLLLRSPQINSTQIKKKIKIIKIIKKKVEISIKNLYPESYSP